MTPEQGQELVRLIQQGEEISPEWARILFPPEKREYELVYHGKEREEDIQANTLAVPLQPVRTFGKNGGNRHNMLIFGDNLQVMKSLLELKKSGKLCNADGTPGVRLVYIDPPFATKRDFSGKQEERAYEDKVEGSAFVEFLRKRLVLIRELLTDDGSVYVHLDQKKSHYIKVIADELLVSTISATRSCGETRTPTVKQQRLGGYTKQYCSSQERKISAFIRSVVHLLKTTSARILMLARTARWSRKLI